MTLSRPPSGTDEEAWARYAASRRRLAPFAEDWRQYKQIYASRWGSNRPAPAWWPDESVARATNLFALIESGGHEGYTELHRNSSRNRAEYWGQVIARLGIVFREPPTAIASEPMDPTNPTWLPGARLNITESCFTAPSDRTAIRFGREGDGHYREVSYGELESLVRRVAGSLLRDGLEAGDAVALYMPMNVECVAAYLGIIRAGLRVVSIADSFSANEVEKRLTIADAKCLVTVTHYRRAGRDVGLYEKIARAKRPRAIVVDDAATSPARLEGEDARWSQWLDPDGDIPSRATTPRDIINILFSSGTTGTPKAIGWTHLTPLKAAADGHFHQDIHADDVVAWPTNIGWMMGPWLIFSSLINQATMALFEGAPTGDGFLQFIERSGVSILGTVPSMVRSWRHGHGDTAQLAGVRVFSSTGEPSNAEDTLWLMGRTDYRAPVIEYLGGTEIGGGHLTGSLLRPAAPSTFNTPALGIDFVILDADHRSVEQGQAGELFLIPPSIGLSQELLNGDHQQVYYEGVPRGPNGEVLRRHGDEIARLEDDYFAARGRADDTMNLGGIKVSSVELETVIDRHPMVRESAAIAVRVAGDAFDRLVVFVVFHPGGDITAEVDGELQAMVKTELNPLFKIHDVVHVDSLPRTASNKIVRRSLRASYKVSG